MFDAQAQAHINKCCSDAAIGYLTATSAAYAAMTDQVLRFWSQSIEAMMPEPAKTTGKSWYVAPGPADENDTEAEEPWASLMMAWMGPGMERNFLKMSFGPFGQPAAGAWKLIEPWMGMVNPQTAVAWPMACSMMAVGIPQSVAWPTAKANVAVMDAFKTAVRSVEEAAGRSRSGGGHTGMRVAH